MLAQAKIDKFENWYKKNYAGDDEAVVYSSTLEERQDIHYNTVVSPIGTVVLNYVSPSHADQPSMIFWNVVK